MASPGPATDKKAACNICRRRKTACDRGRPKCSLCAKSGFPCEYTTSERHPGLRAGYVAQLERRLVDLESRMVAVESREPDRHVTQGVCETDDAGNHLLLPPARLRQSGEGAVTAFTGDGSGLLDSANDVDDMATEGPIATPQATPGTAQRISALSDLLAYPVTAELCDVWFRNYHRWFPILHQPSFAALVHNATTHEFPAARSLVLQAIVAVTLPHAKHIDLVDAQRTGWQSQLADAVVVGAMRSTSLVSIQALLVLSVLYYGNGALLQASNLLAVCRRIGDHLGLRHTITTINGVAATSPSSLRRLPQFVNTIVSQEEEIRAYWMIEMLDSMAAVGARYTIPASVTPGNPLLPCTDSMWAFPESVMSENPIRPYHYCSAFSLCVVLATTELSRVHSFLLRPVIMEDFQERDAWQGEAQRIDERLTIWRDEFVAAVYRLINAEHANHERPEMDPYIVLTNCVLNAAVITLLQQRAPCPDGIEQNVDSWAFASNRCVYASENTAFKVRQMEEDELLICHPYLIFSIFVAARFYLVHTKAMDANVPTNLHSLAFALHMCGKRWSLARAYEKIIRIAVAEYRTPIASSSVPRSFYDLKLTTLEITGALLQWVESVGPEMPVAEGIFSALT